MSLRKSFLFLVLVLWNSPAAFTQTDAAGELLVATPESQGISSLSLAQASRFIREKRWDVRSLLISRHGKIVLERYSRGITEHHNQAVFSITKSVSSCLTGILLKQGKIASIDDPISKYLNKGDLIGRAANKRQISIRHLLTMSSGIRWKEDPRVSPLYGNENRLQVALSQPIRCPPGRQFNYSNADAEIIGGVLTAAARVDLLEFAEKELFKPLGCKNYDWWFEDRSRHPAGYGLRLRPRDMLKFGNLYLQEGMWNDREIVSKEWVRMSLASAGTNANYGFLWWLKSIVKTPDSSEFAAIGWRGQYIVGLPKLSLVIALTSSLPDENMEIIRTITNELILPAVKSDNALPENRVAFDQLQAELKESRRHGGIPKNDKDVQDEPLLQKKNVPGF